MTPFQLGIMMHAHSSKKYAVVVGFVGAVLIGDVARGAASTHAQEGFSEQRLKLEQVFVRPVPDSFRITAMIVSVEGMVAWAPQQRGVLLLGPDQAAVLGRDVVIDPVGAGFSEDGREVNVLDATKRTVTVISRQGEVREIYATNLPVRIHAGLQMLGDWLIGGPDGLGRYRLLRWGPRQPIQDQSTARLRHVFPRRLLLTYNQENVLLTNPLTPFETVSVVEVGDSYVFMRPYDSLQLAASDLGLESTLRWFSSPVVPIEGLYLQTLRDSQSDSTILVLYNESGNVTQRSVLDVPLVFLAADRDQRVLVGIRDLGTRTIVGYRWRLIEQ